MDSSGHRLLTYKEAGVRLGGPDGPLSLSTVQRMVRQGALANVRIGGRVYIAQRSLDQYLDRMVELGVQRQRSRAKRASVRRAG